VDEMDYLITRDRAVLHDLFMFTTLPFSRCILIGEVLNDTFTCAYLFMLSNQLIPFC
jgi:Cdc6-like AAA superfamily ATPase